MTTGLREKKKRLQGEEDELSVEIERERMWQTFIERCLVARPYGAQAASWCPADKRLCVQT